MPAEFPIKAVVAAVDRATAPMRRIGRNIVARIAGPLGRVARAAGRATRTIRRMLGRLSLVGGAVVVGGLAKLITGLANSNDLLSKNARRAGVTAQSYAELKHAFELAGVEQSQFDKAVQKFTRNVGDAGLGIGSLQTHLKKSSPALLEALKGTKNNEEALNLMIAALGKIEDPTKRASLAAAAFGRAGQSMTLILEGGAKGLEDSRKQFRDLHGVISNKALKSSEDFVDAQTRVKLALAGTRQVIGAQLIPIITPILEKMAKWIASNRELIGTKVTAFVVGFGKALNKIDWQGVADFAKRLAEMFGRIWEAIGGADGAMVLWVATMATKFIPSILAIVAALGSLLVSMGLTAAVMKGAMITAAAFAKKALIGLAVVIKGALIAAIGLLKGALISLFTFLAANPIVLVIGAIAAAAAFIIAQWKPVKKFFKELWAGIVLMFEDAWKAIKKTLMAMKRGIESAAESLDLFGQLDTSTSGEQLAINKTIEAEVAAHRAKGRAQNRSRVESRRASASGGFNVPPVGGVASGSNNLKGLVEVKVTVPEGVNAQVKGKTDTPAVPVKASVGRSSRATGGI